MRIVLLKNYAKTFDLFVMKNYLSKLKANDVPPHILKSN